MAVQAKICGINTPIAMKAAVEGGASYVGLVFYPPSPRAVTVTEAVHLAKMVPTTVQTVGLFVNTTDNLLKNALDQRSNSYLDRYSWIKITLGSSFRSSNL